MARELAEEPQVCAAVPEVDTSGGDSLWRPWIDRFERGMRPRPDAWKAVADSDDEEAMASVSKIPATNALDRGDSEFDEAAEDELNEPAPARIPASVRIFDCWTKSRPPQGGVAASSTPDCGFAAAGSQPFGWKVETRAGPAVPGASTTEAAAQTDEAADRRWERENGGNIVGAIPARLAAVSHSQRFDSDCYRTAFAPAANPPGIID